MMILSSRRKTTLKEIVAVRELIGVLSNIKNVTTISKVNNVFKKGFFSTW